MLMLMLCDECKSRERHACMYVMCIELLLCYIMLVWTHTFDIYICHDIMPAFAHAWAVCGEVPQIQSCSKLQNHATFLKDRFHHYVCDCIINPNGAVTYW